MGAKDELEIWGTQESEVPRDPVARPANGHKAACKKPHSPIPLQEILESALQKRSVGTTSVMENYVKVFAVGAASREAGFL